MSAERKTREAEFDNELVRDLSEAVYRRRLDLTVYERNCARDGENDSKIRGRAIRFDSHSRSYLRILQTWPEFPTTVTDELVASVSYFVYCERLGARDAARSIAEDDDGGERMRRRASCYDSLTRTYIDAYAAINFENL